MSTVLVVAAHPDDELLGPGGTLARHVRDGDDVHVVIVAEGATSRYEDEMVDVLAAFTEKAAAVLGVASVARLGFPDQRLDHCPLIEVTQALETHVDQLQPTTVYTHFPGDVNADHGVVSRAAWTACRPYVAPQLRRFLAFETPSSTEWGWPGVGPSFHPSVFVDISTTVEDKLEAMSVYESELRRYPHPRSLQALRERAAYWGSTIGSRAAEAFLLLREVTR